ncbi:ABC transporter ATP-binding protein [Bacteriovorax sp. Seq25_V]|uniref:ABC transporter ATP-binding protein n=1 Tax=Bacteriovorax sp. Seq25_V TaxID=1201288 RepID=UPI00038A2503|nr:ABC transporter ATP-binding protein [Bacteriovorax sp. Seq25_V]EQC47562.1 ABC transporter, ATP-binding protein [Bacteriovorax sp. Seq25_V]
MNTIVEFSDIEKSYPDKKVLKGINFKIEEGSVHGFLGPNGAGKSTLMNILLGLNFLDAGEVKKEEGLKIGYLPEHAPLYLEMKVKHYLKFVQEIYNSKDDQFLEEIIDRLGLREFENKTIGKLSKGYKQRVALAQAICHNPKLLVLDEPLVGLDPHAIIQMKELIKDLSKNHTILISSHQLHDLSQMCNRISIINNGVIVKNGTIDEIEAEIKHGEKIQFELAEDNDQVVKELCHQYKLSFNKVSNCTYEVTSIEVMELKKIVAKFFFEKQIVVLSQVEKKMDLEEIFKSVTSESHQ